MRTDARRSPVAIDGAMGEGGGQILRSALALSLCQRRPFAISAIRSARCRPGLRPQHLLAVRAAAQLSGARVEGAELDSQVLRFDPGPVVPGDYHFDIGTAGSTTLVLQTLLPALLRAARPSRLVLEGGTHNPLAPSFDFLDRVFLPLLRRMGARVQARLQRLGFYPAGGGRIEVEVTPVAALHPVVLLERGRLRRCDAYAVVSRLPGEIAERELRVLASGLDLPADALHLRHDHSARGPGNAVTVVVESEHLTEAFTAYGQKGIPAEQVAAGLLAELRRYLAAGVPVGEHLADQLLLPLALAGGGAFRTLHLSTHASTNMAVIRAFVPVAFDVECLAADDCRVELRADDAREGLGAAD